jgi:hypothetical protein
VSHCIDLKIAGFRYIPKPYPDHDLGFEQHTGSGCASMEFERLVAAVMVGLHDSLHRGEAHPTKEGHGFGAGPGQLVADYQLVGHTNQHWVDQLRAGSKQGVAYRQDNVMDYRSVDASP